MKAIVNARTNGTEFGAALTNNTWKHDYTVVTP